VVEINKYAARIMGLDPASLIGKKCYETICTESRATCPFFTRKAENITYETTVLMPSARRIHVLKSGHRYRVGATEYALETFKDITKLKRMEQEIRDYAENLERKVEQRTQELKQAQLHLIRSEKMAATGRLAASVAHEINNPIYGIRGCLESVLEEGNLSEDLKRFVGLSIKETDRISDLIRRMQNFHRHSRGERNEEDVNAVLTDVLMLSSKLLKEKNIEFKVCFESNLPRVPICTDEMKQVFLNLINNAVEAMPFGGELALSTASRGATVEIQFTDTGCGMTKEVKERIFDAFFTTKSAVKGVGLGLPVCWGIVRSHGGMIDVESTAGKGATFIVTLPALKMDSRLDAHGETNA
jgi:PAS domain S-box-containing protein